MENKGNVSKMGKFFGERKGKPPKVKKRKEPFKKSPELRKKKGKGWGN